MPARASGSKRQSSSGCERKTSGATNGTRWPRNAFWRPSSDLSRFALRLASSSGLSIAARPRMHPVGCARHVPASPSQPSRPALDLNEEEALGRDHEHVDLADRAVEQELEVRPGSIGLVVGQALLEERQRVALPRELGWRDLGPVSVHRRGRSYGAPCALTTPLRAALEQVFGRISAIERLTTKSAA